MMYMAPQKPSPHWDENTSEQFLDYGKYFIPARELQLQIMVDMLANIPHPAHILELCCGEGLLAELILLTYPLVSYHGMDGSPLMLEKAGQRLSPFANRIILQPFELADGSWRILNAPIHAVISSMAIHHLDGDGKQQLFKDVFSMLDSGGIFIISDLVEPLTSSGWRVAADAWDAVVRERSLKYDGNTDGWDFFTREHWNTYRYPDPEDIDHPSPLITQLKWLEVAGFRDIEVHFLQAGHALFSAWKRPAIPDINVQQGVRGV
jgi:tRNA (cmo5U34)-methyltransferase